MMEHGWHEDDAIAGGACHTFARGKQVVLDSHVVAAARASTMEECRESQ